MKGEELKNLIATYTEDVWNKASVPAMDRYYAADYIHHDVSRPDVNTLADYKQWARDLLAGLPDLHVAIDDLIAEEGKAVKRWTASGMHTGTLAGFAPTNRRITFSGVSTYRLAGNKIVESWYLYDLFGLVQQLSKTPEAVIG